MSDEVRYQMLRPAEIVARRQACPVVYIPIGTLEWHGVHNPVGADTLQAEGLAILCARKGGGLVFPPLYYGESRSESLMEAGAEDRDKIAEAMGLSPDNFLPERQPFSPTEQVLNYQRLLLHVLAEAETLGFEVGVLVAGHYPLIDHARAAVLLFNQRR
jgi:creatinine amidohydrolase